MTLNYDFDAQRGTLNSRTNSMFSWSETFGYDSLDRLVTFNDNDGNKSHTYDASGRITENTTVGSYNYIGNSFQLNGVELNDQGDLFYQNNNLQQVSYNAFKSPHEIKEKDKDRIGFQYNAFMERSHRFYGGFEDDVLQRNNRKHYSFDGSMEISYDSDADKTEIVTFIAGDAYSAPVLWKSEQGTSSISNNFYFLHRDHMNSILMITDNNAVVVEKRHFDAWGNIVQLADGNGNILEDFKIIDRGYTGHEHLSSVGLIHMNGRLYDANLKRFLSPDNYIQDITNTQNFNRYGYVLNNPLMYWDPTGEQTEDGGGGLLGWGAAVLASAIATSWDTIKSWDWKGFGDAIARPFREVGRFFSRLFGGGKKSPTIREVDNPQNLTMDPLARSSLGSIPSTSFGIGEAADIGLRIVKGYMDFDRGVNTGIVGGGKSTWNFVKSLGTAQGWKNLGQGFVDMADMGNGLSARGMVLRGQMGMAVTDFVTNIPNMSAYEVGYAVGYGTEKVVESVLLSKGAGLVGNVVRGTSVGTQGGLNLFKFGSSQATKSSWKAGDRFLRLPNRGTPKLNWKQNSGYLRQEMGRGKPIFDSFRLSNGNLIPTGGFLNAERALLNSRGWIYNPKRGAWLPPGF
jgi:RHS repeat-associated protein